MAVQLWRHLNRFSPHLGLQLVVLVLVKTLLIRNVLVFQQEEIVLSCAVNLRLWFVCSFSDSSVFVERGRRPPEGSDCRLGRTQIVLGRQHSEPWQPHSSVWSGSSARRHAGRTFFCRSLSTGRPRYKVTCCLFSELNVFIKQVQQVRRKYTSTVVCYCANINHYNTIQYNTRKTRWCSTGNGRSVCLRRRTFLWVVTLTFDPMTLNTFSAMPTHTSSFVEILPLSTKSRLRGYLIIRNRC